MQDARCIFSYIKYILKYTKYKFEGMYQYEVIFGRNANQMFKKTLRKKISMHIINL